MPKKSCKKSYKRSYKKSCKNRSKSCKSKTRNKKLYNMKCCSNTKCNKKSCPCNKKNKKKQKGGNLVRNMFRDLGYNVNSAYNAANGVHAPINPSPYNGQFANSKSILV